jgi:phosphoglycolate phosphatase-like HAD superfamily hydrolase
MTAMPVFLFDIDGTLVSSGGAGKASMEQAMETAFGVRVGAHGIPFSGRTDRAIGRDLFTLHGVEESPANWQRFLEDYLEHLPGQLTGHPGRIMPGIVALLEMLGSSGDNAVGLLTGNVRAGARVKLGHFGLFEHFAFGGFGDLHHDRDNVAHEALAAVRTHLGANVDLRQTWVIGDTPLDVRCARAIGARVAAVATGWHSLEELALSEPDVLLADLSDPGPLLAAIR